MELAGREDDPSDHQTGQPHRADPDTVTTGARTRGQTFLEEQMTGRHQYPGVIYPENRDLLAEEEFEGKRTSGYRSADTDTVLIPRQRPTLRACSSETQLRTVRKSGGVLFAMEEGVEQRDPSSAGLRQRPDQPDPPAPSTAPSTSTVHRNRLPATVHLQRHRAVRPASFNCGLHRRSSF